MTVLIRYWATSDDSRRLVRNRILDNSQSPLLARGL